MPLTFNKGNKLNGSIVKSQPVVTDGISKRHNPHDTNLPSPLFSKEGKSNNWIEDHPGIRRAMTREESDRHDALAVSRNDNK